jgi:hypothetical protein
MRTGDQQRSRPILADSIQKSYFMLSRSARNILDTALRKYRVGRTDLIPIGGIAQLKPALRLMMATGWLFRTSTAPRCSPVTPGGLNACR